MSHAIERSLAAPLSEELSVQEALMEKNLGIEALLRSQRTYYASGATRQAEFRLSQLQILLDSVKAAESEIFEALKADLGRCAEESYISEVGFLYEEIRYAMRHLRRWMRTRRVSTPWYTAVGHSRIYIEPLGSVLILGPWNYPLQLVLAPLIGAIAAGNCAVLKPSELAPHTSRVLARIIAKAFDPAYVALIEGGAEASQAILKERFDHIFFTGGLQVGKIIMTAAAKHLTPVTLELGGKSPCIVDADTDLDVSARRIAWGKFFNAGQTCVAPDYLLVDKRVKDELLAKIAKHTQQFFGEDPAASADYARIVNRSHFDRLVALLEEGGHVVFGGGARAESLYIAPTLVADVDPQGSLMADEIFGPILPVLEYQDLDEAISLVNARPKPLALYFFSRDKARQERVVAETSFGGGCINDTLMHLSNPHLPFGGVGSSGIGAYHGRYSFETFSHKKSVLVKSFAVDPYLRYPPYAGRMKWLRRLLGSGG